MYCSKKATNPAFHRHMSLSGSDRYQRITVESPTLLAYLLHGFRYLHHPPRYFSCNQAKHMKYGRVTNHLPGRCLRSIRLTLEGVLTENRAHLLWEACPFTPWNGQSASSMVVATLVTPTTVEGSVGIWAS